MPEWLAIRKHQLSIAHITSIQGTAWRELMRDCREWVKIERVYGPESVMNAYKRIGDGQLGPEKGLIWSLWEEEGKQKEDEKTAAKL